MSRPLTRHEAGVLRAHYYLLSDLSAKLSTRVPYLYVEMISCAERIDNMLLAYGINGDADKKVDAVLKDATVLIDRVKDVMQVDIYETPLVVDGEVVEVF